ncbi:MAG TPA: insulinase family protein [Candidatus Acetothermia bacterium]|nr:insulinase family protein [Candidatus Acetothermia bacterium]
MIEIYPGCYQGCTASGVAVLAEPMPSLRSVAVGLWVRAGGRDDPPGKEGLAHLLEHMTFKGTARHSAAEIAQAIDLLGGHLNAATANEYTFYYTEVLDEGLPPAVSILEELVTLPRFARDDLGRERVVIEEEIRTIEDSPEDVAFQLLHEALWPGGHPLGQPVVGRLASVAELGRDDLLEFFRHHYTPARMALVACGRVDPTELLSLATRFGSGGEHDGERPRRPPEPGSGVVLAERAIQQVHLAVGFPTIPIGSPHRYGIEVLNALLGGGVSSRLFQRVREELGLAYTVFSATSYYSDAGALALYAATEEKKLPRVVDLLWGEVEALARTPPPPSDLRRAIQRLVNAFLLGLDDPSGRMVRLGTAIALGRTPAPPDEVVRRLRAVTGEEVQELAQRFLNPDRAAWAAVGPCGDRLRQLLRPYAEVA